MLLHYSYIYIEILLILKLYAQYLYSVEHCIYDNTCLHYDKSTAEIWPPWQQYALYWLHYDACMCVSIHPASYSNFPT